MNKTEFTSEEIKLIKANLNYNQNIDELAAKISHQILNIIGIHRTFK